MLDTTRVPPATSDDDGVYVTNVEMADLNSFKPPTPTYDHPEDEEETRKCGKIYVKYRVFVSLEGNVSFREGS